MSDRGPTLTPHCAVTLAIATGQSIAVAMLHYAGPRIQLIAV